MFDHIELDPKRRATSDFVEWNPKRHGQKPPYWLPDMLTSVDGKNFARQPNWAWIAGSTYYVPREAMEMPRIEPEPAQTDGQLIEAVAKAIYVAYVQNPNAGWDARNPTKKSNIWFLQAPAAIAAAKTLIRAQVIQEIREAVEREAMSDVYNCTIGGGAAQALRIIYAALEKQP